MNVERVGSGPDKRVPVLVATTRYSLYLNTSDLLLGSRRSVTSDILLGSYAARWNLVLLRTNHGCHDNGKRTADVVSGIMKSLGLKL